MCVCVFTDVVILQSMQQDIMTLRNVMMSMVDIIEHLYQMLYTIIRMSEGWWYRASECPYDVHQSTVRAQNGALVVFNTRNNTI